MALAAFLDTSVLVAGLIDFGPQSAPAQALLHEVAERRVSAAGTAWHCCLEFFSVSTRLPPEFRLTGSEAARLVEEEIVRRMSVHDLPSAERMAALKLAAQDGAVGGRIYDTHIAEVARSAEAIVTDNRRHFLAALKHGIRVETPTEFLHRLKDKRR